MYPSVLPQAEVLAKLEDNAKLASKSWALRTAGGKNNAAEEEEEESTEESSSESEEESEPEHHTNTIPAQRPVAPRSRSAHLERRDSDGVRKVKEEQRPRSLNRQMPATRPTPRSTNLSPVARRQNTSTERRATVEDEVDGEATARPSRAGSTTPPHSRSGRPERRDTPPTRETSRISPPTKSVSPKRPNALSFLDPDSPEVTEDHIRRVLAEAQASSQWSPRSASSSSSSSNDSASQRSNAETDTTTPENSINGDPLPQSSSEYEDYPQKHNPPSQPPSVTAPEHKYGTPEMARGPAKHPHLPPRELQPRLAAPGQGHAKHLPRAEKLPMSGYELLAAKLSNTFSSSSHNNPPSRRRSCSSRIDDSEPAIKPIYRRFEALNHRLLLHLQDELSELEEQLHRLDTADTQTRRLANCILPASRRAEFMAGGELQWHKTDLLGKVGFKLGQYNHVLSSFKETQSLPSASLSDIETYRTYLATKNPIAEIETRFLDPAGDLVCLAGGANGSPTSSTSSSSDVPSSSEDMLTPMPLKTTFGFSPSPSTTAATSRKQSVDDSPTGKTDDVNTTMEVQAKPPTQTTGPAAQIATLCALAIIAPILAFPVVTDFVGRMALVLVAGLAVAALRRRMVDAGVWEGGELVLKGEADDGLAVVGVYGVVMGVIAMLF